MHELPSHARVPLHFRIETRSCLWNSFLDLSWKTGPQFVSLTVVSSLTFPAPHHLGNLSGWTWREGTGIDFPLEDAGA